MIFTKGIKQKLLIEVDEIVIKKLFTFVNYSVILLKTAR